MLETLQTVLVAVADRDLVPILTHLQFRGGRVMGGDSRITVNAPLSVPELEGLCVPAAKLVKAVAACGGQPNLKRDDAGTFVQVSKGRTRIKLPCRSADEYVSPPLPPDTPAEGKLTKAPLARVRKYVSQDASKPFSVGVLLRNGYAYATNNVILVRTPVDYSGPEVCIPVYCVEELLKLPIEEYSIHFAENGLYLRSADTWVHTLALAHRWPDVERFFDGWSEPPAVDAAALKTALKTVRDFVPDDNYPIMRFVGNVLKTLDGEYTAEVDGFDVADSAWRYEMLDLVLQDADRLDFAAYPKPARWSGNGLQGMLTGSRL